MTIPGRPQRHPKNRCRGPKSHGSAIRPTLLAFPKETLLGQVQQIGSSGLIDNSMVRLVLPNVVLPIGMAQRVGNKIKLPIVQR